MNEGVLTEIRRRNTNFNTDWPTPFKTDQTHMDRNWLLKELDNMLQEKKYAYEDYQPVDKLQARIKKLQGSVLKLGREKAKLERQLERSTERGPASETESGPARTDTGSELASGQDDHGVLGT